MDLQKLDKNTLILDFDGTICRLFENYNLEGTKQILISVMNSNGFELEEVGDCFDVFKIICNQYLTDFEKRKQILLTVDKIITEAECEAVENCIPVEYFEMLNQEYENNNIGLAIASNNSARCISKYLRINGYNMEIPIIGRDGVHPEHMKPDAWTINEALKILGIKSDEGIFVGDTINDYMAAQTANMKFIGMVPTQKKKERLFKFNKTIMAVDNYKELLAVLNR